jgi:integrase
VIVGRYSEHVPGSEIAIHTGMRPSEQYGLHWSRVDLVRNFLSLPKTKKGKARHILLNAVAMAALKRLQKRSLNGEGPVLLTYGERG